MKIATSRSPAPTAPRVPVGRRIYAIGDIHGRLDLLTLLHQQIRDDAQTAVGDKLVVYLGDYIDRGPASRAVIDALIAAPLPGFARVFLKGNHEDMMLRFLAGPPDPLWLFNGGIATLASYRVIDADFVPGHWDLELLQQRMRSALPPSHGDFLLNLSLKHEEGDYLFVHAGVRPGVPLDAQQPEDLMWIRAPFLKARKPFGRRIVHGHTITEAPEVTENRIGIDTGAFYSDCLTCLVLEGDQVRFLQT